MRSLEQYLSTQTQHSHLTLVGPLCSASTAFADPVVFVDRGVQCRKGKEGFSVGDQDSALRSLDLVLNPSKDFSDLAYVLDRIPERFSTLHLEGFLGGRRDHELCNLAEAHRTLRRRTAPLKITFDRALVAFSRGQWELPHKGLFTLFCFEEAQTQISGDCRYSASDTATLEPLASHGLSNEASGLLKIDTQGPCFLFLNS